MTIIAAVTITAISITKIFSSLYHAIFKTALDVG